ncbi:adenylate/guanylate cyclase domain-containing protein [Geodermatophilus sp. SYSU D00815]
MSAPAEPDTRYARLGDERIAYQVVGSGPPDLVLSAGTFNSIDLDWEDPALAAMYHRMSRFCRLIRFDRRGSGASDPLPLRSLPPWESYTEEVVAVMDAVGARRAAVMGVFDAGPMAALFAATHPGRTVALVLVNTAARVLRSDDYPIGTEPERAAAVVDQVVDTWGSEEQVHLQVPSRASDERFRRWFARYTRSIASPGAVRAYLTAMLQADARAALGSVHVPTLVMHRRDYAMYRIEHGRYLADAIEGATFVELPGRDGPLAWEHPGTAVDAIEEFLTGARRSTSPERALVTIVFTDIVGSTELADRLGDQRWRELLDRHDDTARSVVTEFGGRLVETTGDGVLATFPGPGRAIEAARTLRDTLCRSGLRIRTGAHTGEVELRGAGVGGMAVHIAARVMQAAGAGEILVSRTVRDVLVGSGIRLSERGARALKGVPEEWELFSVAA